MACEFELAFLPKERTTVGIGWMSGMGDCKGKQTTFHEISIGIGLVVLYITLYKKGRV